MVYVSLCAAHCHCQHTHLVDRRGDGAICCAMMCVTWIYIYYIIRTILFSAFSESRIGNY